MTAEAGHNAQPPMDAILGVHFAQFLRAEAALSEAKAEHKDDLSHLDGKGLNLKAAKIAAPIIRQGAAATLAYASLIRDVLALLEVGGSPIESDQIELFATVDARTPLEDRAYQDGRRAAFFDKSDGDNPHGLSTQLGQEWLRGFNQGKVEVDLVNAMAPENPELVKGQDMPADPPDDPFQVAAE